MTVIEGPECPFGLDAIVSTTDLTDHDPPTVVGYFQCPTGYDRAFYWQEGVLVPLDYPWPVFRSWAFGISDAGAIVGSLDIADDGLGSLGFLWTDGEALILAPLAGGTWSEAFAINAAGLVSGYSETPSSPFEAVVWSDGEPAGLGADLTAPKSQGHDINCLNQVTGFQATIVHSDDRAFIWDAGRTTDLGPIPGGSTSRASALSSTGRVVGAGKLAGGMSRAFMWEDGKMLDLGAWPGYEHSFALDVNDQGVIIGFSTSTGMSPVPLVWFGGAMFDINSLVVGGLPPTVYTLWAINQHGVIVGFGRQASGEGVGVILTPLDPPAVDLNGDCRVGFADLLILLSVWATSSAYADFDGDGVVGLSDLLLLLADWSPRG